LHNHHQNNNTQKPTENSYKPVGLNAQCTTMSSEPEVLEVLGINQEIVEGVSFIGGFLGIIILMMIAQVIFLKTLEGRIKKESNDSTTVELSEVKKRTATTTQASAAKTSPDGADDDDEEV